MPELTRQQKITFGEMRAAGVRGLLIYCSDYKCSHWTTMARTDGRMTFGCPILSPSSPAKLAARGAPTPARISTGSGPTRDQGDR